MKLGDVADIVAGFAFSESYQGRTNLPTPFIKVSDFAAAKESWISSAANTVDDSLLRLIRAKVYPAGTVIFPKVGGALLTNKRARLEVAATFDNNVMGLIPRRVDGDYLFWFMRQFDMAKLANTQAIPSVRSSDVAQIEIPVPNLLEQRKIAARLKAQLAEVETARQAAQAQVKDAQRLRTRIMDALFDKIHDWQPISAVAKVQSGYAFKSENFTTSGVRLLRNTNILPGKVYWDEVVYLDEEEARKYPSYVLAEGDILISLDRPLISSGIKVARISKSDLPALLLQRVGRFLLKPGAVDPDFLHVFLQSSRFVAEISGHDQSLGVPHISPGQVEAIELPALPIEKQREVATHLKAQLAEADAIHRAATAQLAEIEFLPQQLLAQAFPSQGDVK
ncbi:MAG: restriction endonuclease subunit S [Luteimonas sp.]|nr:restriction endonuclease subunit S [Luteimonas sp.]